MHTLCLVYQLIAIIHCILVGPPRNTESRHLPNVCSPLYSEVSLINDQYSPSTATEKQEDNGYEIPIPLPMFEVGTDKRF